MSGDPVRRLTVAAASRWTGTPFRSRGPRGRAPEVPRGRRLRTLAHSCTPIRLCLAGRLRCGRPPRADVLGFAKRQLRAPRSVILGIVTVDRGGRWRADPAGVFFSDRFNVDPQTMGEHGAFDISVVSDLPVFIDPFLLFNSPKSEYTALHEQILEYLRFLRDKADGELSPGLMKSLYTFGEVKQNWLGFTVGGNGGRGLGPKFADRFTVR